MHKVVLFAGLILLAVGIVVYFAIGTVTHYNGNQVMGDGLRMTLQLSIGGFLALLGILLIIGAMKAKSRNDAQQKQNMHILQTGMSTEGTVTFVDKNYAVKINRVPIYSIVEYVYKDNSGNQHTRRISNLSSELVIRKKIEVGAKIPVKYAVEDSSKSVMVL
jgi:hypothetical protein